MNLRIKYLFISLACIFFFNLYLSAETIEDKKQIENELDSLLIAGEFQMVSELLTSGKKSVSYNLRTKYLKTIREINFLDGPNIDSSYIDELVQKYKSNKEMFDTEYAGEKANVAYNKFLELSNNNNIEAVKCYITADFFKLKHLESKIKEIKIKLQRAKYLFKKLKKKEALNVIDSINITPRNHPELNDLNNEVTYLRKRISRSEFNKRMFGKKEKVNYIFNANVGLNIDLQNPLEREILVFDPELGIKHGFTFLVNLSLYKRLFLGIDFTHATSSHTGGNQDLGTWYNLKETSRITRTYLQFFLRDKAGLRPHINLGLGHIYVSAESTYLLEKAEYSSLQALSEIGIEYINSYSSRISLGSKFSLGYNFRDFETLNRFNTSFKVYMGTFF